MSRQSKNAKRLAAAREMAKIHKNGGKGPAATVPQHGKKKRKFNSDEAIKARHAVLKKNDKTYLEKLKEGDSVKA
jgi:hypothetical protein